jgi:hypothetical protein
MPQTKEVKRKTAIRLYNQAIEFHERAMPDCLATQVDKHRSKIRNLRKLVDSTSAKH